MNVLASPLVPNSPLTPKSQSFTCPSRHKRIFDGLMSAANQSVSNPNWAGMIDVRKTHTSMDDFPAVEIRQSVKYSFGHLTQYLLPGTTAQLLDFLVYTVQTASFTEFHCDRNGARGLVHERAVVTADMVGRTVFIEIKLSNDLLLHIGIGVRRDDLASVSAVNTGLFRGK